MLCNRMGVLAVGMLFAINTGASIPSNIRDVLTKSLDLKEMALSKMDQKAHGFDYKQYFTGKDFTPQNTALA